MTATRLVNDENPPDTPYLFVYGTLMKEFDNPFAEQLRKHSEYIGKGFFPGKLVMVAGYPGARYLEGVNSLVHGELYRLNKSRHLFPLLDEYEDIGSKSSLYIRKIIPISTTDGQNFFCWVYLYNLSAEGLHELPDGRFRRSNP